MSQVFHQLTNMPCTTCPCNYTAVNLGKSSDQLQGRKENDGIQMLGDTYVGVLAVSLSDQKSR